MPLLRWFACVLCLIAAACLEVDSMEVQVVADAANDRLDVMIISRGVSSSATTKDNLAKDFADLMKCRDAAAVPLPGVGVMDFTQPDDAADSAKWRRAIQYLEIEAGAFFVDESGRFSFYQFLRVHRPAELAKVVSAMAAEGWQKELERATPETRELMQRAAREQWPLLVFDGAGVVVRRPLADDDHRQEQQKFWRAVIRAVREPEKQATEEGQKPIDPSDRGLVQLLRDNDVAVVRRPGVTEYHVGTQGAPVCDYQLRGKPYVDNLLQELVQNEPRPPAVNQALIEKQFATFRQRNVRMPAAFAAAKKAAAAAK